MNETFRWSSAVRAALATFGLVCLVGGTARAQQNAKPAKPRPAPALLLAPLTGQPIPVLPLTYIVSDTGLAGMPATRAAQLIWADSIIADGLLSRGPEATWVTQGELRRATRRGAGMVKNPDQMAQAIMRFENLKSVPDPLLENIRMLVAITGSRYVMIPAALHFSQVPEGVRVESVLVLADARSGAIAWRSFPVVIAPTAGAALAGIIARVLPDAQ